MVVTEPVGVPPKEFSLAILPALLISVAYFIFLLFFLPQFPIGSSSEAREAHVIQSMLETGSVLLPERNGIVISKPPLFHWTGMLLSRALELSPMYSARLVSAFAATLLLFLTMQFARHLFPHAGEVFPVFAGAALSTNYEFIRLSLDCRVDMLFSVLVFIAFEQAYLYPRGRPGLFCIAAALAVLTKGPLGLVLPLLVSAAALGVSGGWKRLFEFFRRAGPAWIVFLVLAPAWYLYAAMNGAHSLLARQLIFENIRRFFGGELMNTQPFWYYLEKGISGSFPWFLIYLLAIPYGIRQLLKAGRERTADIQVQRMNMLFAGFLAGLVLLSAASGKRYSYLAPLFPLLSIYTAYIVRFLLSRVPIDIKPLSKALAAISIQLVALFVLAAGIVSVAWSVPDARVMFMKDFLNAGLLSLSVAGAAVLAVCYAAGISRTAGAVTRLLASYAAFEFFVLALIFSGVGARNALCRFEETAGDIRGIVKSDDVQVVRELYDEYFDPVLYYLGRRVRIVAPSSAPSPCSGYLLAKREWDAAKAQGEGICVLTEVARFARVHDAWKGGDGQDMILFRCSSRPS